MFDTGARRVAAKLRARSVAADCGPPNCLCKRVGYGGLRTPQPRTLVPWYVQDETFPAAPGGADSLLGGQDTSLVLVFAVVSAATEQAVGLFVRREDAERFLEEVPPRPSPSFAESLRLEPVVLDA